MLEQRIVEPGAERDRARLGAGLDLDGDGVERGDTGQQEGLSSCRANPLMSSSERLEHDHARASEPGLGEKTGERRGAFAVGGERDDARAMMEMRANAGKLAAMQRDERRLGQRPA